MKHLNPRYMMVMIAILLFFLVNNINAQSPTITSFTPHGTCPDSSATLYIFGTNFTGATAVTIGGKSVDSFTINSATSIIATMQLNSSGVISVITPNGVATTLDSFTNNVGYTPYAYIPNSGDSSVSVVNITNNILTASIPVGHTPYDIAISPDGKRVYVPNYDDNSLSVINTATNSVISVIPVGANPDGISISPDGSSVYVSNSNNATVSVINTDSEKVVTTIFVGCKAGGLSISPDGKILYVSCSTDGSTIVVVNTATNTIKTSVIAGYETWGSAVTPDGSRVYVADLGSNVVSVISTAVNSNMVNIPVGNEPTGVCVSPDGTKIYVSNYLDNTINVISTATNSVTATIQVGYGPQGICVTPDGRYVYVANYNNTVSIINTATNALVSSITVGANPVSFGKYIANIPTTCGSLPVSIIDLQARNNNEAVVVNWHTATEINTSHFNIQHSSNGTSFTEIGNVPAIGKGANSYEFTDNKPNNGINYYRLQSVDKDGASTFSKVVSVQLTVNSNQLTVFPNPSKDNVTISGNHIASVQVIDNMGRVVKVVSLKDATNPSLSVSSLPAGVYHLRVQTTDGEVSGVGMVKE